MLGCLVVTHGGLADELVAAATKIVGVIEALEAVSIDWDDDVMAARQRIDEAVGRLDDGDGVLVLTDMFGGTPSNIALSLIDPGRVDVVTGVNLPMLIKLANHRERYELRNGAERIVSEGRESIHAASGLLQAGSSKDGS